MKTLIDRSPNPAFFADTFEFINSQLSREESYVINNYLGFIDGKSFAEIGKDLNMSRQAAQQLYKRTIKRLQHTELMKAAGIL